MQTYLQERALVERWLKEENPKFRIQAKHEDAQIFVEDELGVWLEFRGGATSAPKGKAPVVRVTGSHSV